jgi:hypothetical protein
VLAALALAMGARPAGAAIITISSTGTTGPEGTITFAETGLNDPSSANFNTDFTALGPIPVTATVSAPSSISIYGNNVNDTSAAWGGFTATIVGGAATFQDPNDPFNPYGTYTDTPGWSVALGSSGTTAVFSGTPIAPGDSLDTFPGLAVTDSSLPITINLAPSIIPEPSSLVVAALGATMVGAIGLRRRRTWGRGMVLAAIAALATPASWAKGPQVVPAYQQAFTLKSVGGVGGHPTQMTFGPLGRLYVMTTDQGAISFAYDPTTGALSSPVKAAPQVKGIGIAFHQKNMYMRSFDGTIHKLSDANGNGIWIWGEAGELDVAIVTGIPQGDHNTDQLQVVGDTLYVGIGRRTINGNLGAWTGGTIDDLGGKGFFNGGLGRTYGDSAYNGTIAWIRDLTHVVNQKGSANAWTTNPPILTRKLIQHDEGPFTTVDPGKLVVHSAGTRNPFGLCLDSDGNLWFTNNFNRTATLGNGQAGFGLRGDQLDSDFSRDVQDQLFRASPGADYGYTDANWRDVNPMLTPTAPDYHHVKSVTFDNLYNHGPYVLHDPANPDGLGPSSSSDGCSLWYSAGLPAELAGNIFIARYNGTIREAPGGLQRSLTYSDLVAVDPSSGKVRRIAFAFANPLAVLADNTSGRLLIADYGDQAVYALQIAP